MSVARLPAPEEWRPVVGWPEYAVSNTGRIVSYRRGEPCELRTNVVGGYPMVTFRVAPRSHCTAVHRVVAAAFLGPRPDGMEVRHLDGNRLNNDASNLAFGTRAENMQDKLRHGTNHKANTTHCPQGHPYDEANTYRYKGHRACRICRRAAAQAYHDRQVLAAANVPFAEEAS